MRYIDFISIGRIEPIKNFDYAFKIIKGIQARYDINYHVVGNGSLLSKFKIKYAKNDKIVFHGEEPNYWVGHLLKSSKFLLHTSKVEGFGLTVLEAMLFGCIPIITPFNNDMVKIVANNNGLIIRFNEVYRSIEECMDFYDGYKNNRLKFDMEKAKQYVIKNHDVHNLRDRYINIFFGE